MSIALAVILLKVWKFRPNTFNLLLFAQKSFWSWSCQFTARHYRTTPCGCKRRFVDSTPCALCRNWNQCGTISLQCLSLSFGKLHANNLGRHMWWAPKFILAWWCSWAKGVPSSSLKFSSLSRLQFVACLRCRPNSRLLVVMVHELIASKKFWALCIRFSTPSCPFDSNMQIRSNCDLSLTSSRSPRIRSTCLSCRTRKVPHVPCVEVDPWFYIRTAAQCWCSVDVKSNNFVRIYSPKWTSWA